LRMAGGCEEDKRKQAEVMYGLHVI
jgi:hypothetical protein